MAMRSAGMKQDARGWLWVMEGTEGPFLGPGDAAGVGRVREPDGSSVGDLGLLARPFLCDAGASAEGRRLKGHAGSIRERPSIRAKPGALWCLHQRVSAGGDCPTLPGASGNVWNRQGLLASILGGPAQPAYSTE